MVSVDRSLISVLIRDHRRIMDLIMRLPTTHGPDRRRLVDRMSGELILHAVAEDLYLYPTVHSTVPRWAIDVAMETGAHTRIEHLLAEISSTDAADATFGTLVTRLICEVERETMHEELSVFPWLSHHSDRRTLVELGDKIIAFKKAAVVEKTPGHGLLIRYHGVVLDRWEPPGQGAS
ncbi:hemerythrin domain-containing protein [Actinoallomurus acaciae]|uniref:Hemerythrin domain-containing protein n=1 Tax=Actinoallomurus acaciae TaxID=502577 RepID=A0ABV5YQG3_9ACTN